MESITRSLSELDARRQYDMAFDVLRGITHSSQPLTATSRRTERRR